MNTIRTNKGIIKVVKDYFEAMIANDEAKAMGCVSKSFTGEINERWMKQYLRMFADVTEFEVVEVDRKSDNFAQVRVQTYDGIMEVEYHINLLREIAPYELSEKGTWGVNPVSLQMI